MRRFDEITDVEACSASLAIAHSKIKPLSISVRIDVVVQK